LAAAKRTVENAGVRLILVGARFDESRMFDLLDYIRKDAEHKKIPIVAAVIGPTSMSSDTVRGLAHTTKIFGASVFVNLTISPTTRQRTPAFESSSMRCPPAGGSPEGGDKAFPSAPYREAILGTHPAS
jgi:hypothetical protein